MTATEADQGWVTALIRQRPGELHTRGGECGRPKASGRGPCAGVRVVISADHWYALDTQEQWELGGCRRHLTPAEDAFRQLAERSANYLDSVIRVSGMTLLGEMDKYERWEAERHDEARRPTPGLPACWGWFRDEIEAMAIGGKPQLVVKTVDELKKWQESRCALCGHTYGLVLDHDHWSELIRGFLCRDCNSAEGTGEHHGRGAYWPVGCGPMNRYRLLNPARWFGLKLTYNQANYERNWGKPAPDDNG